MRHRSQKQRWPSKPTIVAFGDMLGFASLVEKQEDPDEARLVSVERYLKVKRVSQNVLPLLEKSRGSSGGQRETVPTPLERRFLLFHRIVNQQVDRLALTERVTAIVFSDSFFVASDDIGGVLSFCAWVLVNLTLNGIPARMGVAEGSFHLHQWALRRSPIQEFSTVQFLGKGVVRAHRTESCGLKGMRIGLHPSLMRVMQMNAPALAIPLREAESKKDCTHELNYLLPLLLGEETAPDVQRMVSDAVEAMQASAARKAQTQVHYRRTKAAIRRMIRVGRSWRQPA